MTYSSHDHRFEEPDEVFVDEVLVIRQQCQYVPINGSQYSEELDEVFYDEGPQCEAMQVTYYNPATIVDVHEVHATAGGPVVDLLGDEELPRWAEDAWMEAEKQISDRVDPYPDPVLFDPDEPEISITIDTDDTEYRIRYERSDQEVNQI